MYSRVLALVVSVLLLASSMLASAPAIAMPDQPQVVLAVLDQSSGELPSGAPASHDQSESVLDIPDQLDGPHSPPNASAWVNRVEPDVLAGMRHPYLKGPQRPPRASGRFA